MNRAWKPFSPKGQPQAIPGDPRAPVTVHPLTKWAVSKDYRGWFVTEDTLFAARKRHGPYQGAKEAVAYIADQLLEEALACRRTACAALGWQEDC